MKKFNFNTIWVLAAFVIWGMYLFLLPSVSRAQEDSGTTIAVFVREGCVHCRDEEEFLHTLSGSRQTVQLEFYRLENPDHRRLWEEFTTTHAIAKVTPITIIGNSYLVGFDAEKSTGEEIIFLLSQAEKSGEVTDLNSGTLKPAGTVKSACPEDGSIPCTVNTGKSLSLSIPFVGKIESGKYPLILLSAMLGFFDGFNPCAMWVLVAFLIILIEVGNRRKMIVFAGTFILAEALMYTLILTVWYKTWDFVRLDTYVTPAVGLVSIIGGLFFLRQWHKKELECKVTNIEERARTTSRIQQLATGKFTVFTLLGILGIAFSVNIIEFACSIGIPQAFTKILELNALPPYQTVFMIFLYIFFYMLDDFFVFGLAIWGADHLGLTTRYSKLSNLAGGVVMILLGIMLIFRSNLLLF